MSYTPEIFKHYSAFYDLLYKDKNYAAEVTHLLELLAINGVTKGDLLEYGSGTGAHARMIVQQGYSVHGIELSEDMIAEAEIVSGFTCQQGDIGRVRMGRTYDAVFSLFHVMSYQTDNAQLKAVFNNAAIHLKPGGLFIFDFWYSPAVYSQRPSIRIKRFEDDQVAITRLAEPVVWPNLNIVDINYTIYASLKSSKDVNLFEEKHVMRHFSLPEIRLMAEINGFDLLSAQELVSRKKPDESTWGVCVVLKRQ